MADQDWINRVRGKEWLYVEVVFRRTKIKTRSLLQFALLSQYITETIEGRDIIEALIFAAMCEETGGQGQDEYDWVDFVKASKNPVVLGWSNNAKINFITAGYEVFTIITMIEAKEIFKFPELR